MASWLNIVAVPEGGGNPRRFRVSIFWLKAGAVIFCVAIIGVLFGAISYSGLLIKAATYSKLEQDNLRLSEENRRILAVSAELRQSQEVLAQIIRALGGHLEVGAISQGETPATPPHAEVRETVVEPESRESKKPLFRREPQEPATPSVSEPAIFTMDSSGVPSMAVDIYDLPSKMPVNGFISQGFTMDRMFPARSHRGIDIAGMSGEPVVSAASGRVVFEGWTPLYGNCLLIVHANGYVTFYGHNQTNLKRVDQEVKRGEPIALLGNSGRSTAPHLHFEIWRDGEPMDPLEFVNQKR